ncbi:hypothetical protein Tco_1385839 [Tanacetum coccineum]
MGDANPIRTLGDYSKPSYEGYKITIELPKGNNVLAIGLNVFQQDTRFLAQFFPPGRTAKLRNDILIMRIRQFAMNQGPRNFNEAANAWKGKPNFNWAQAQTFTSPRNGSFSTYSSNYQMKLEKALIDFDSHQEKRLSRSPAAQMNFTSANDLTKEELRGKGIKRPSKLLFLKYLSQSSLVEQNRNPSSPKRIHFVNSIVILNKKLKIHEELTVESEEEEKDMVNNREIIESIVEPSKSEEEEPLKKLS